MKGGKKPAAMGSKGKGKKNPKKRPTKKGAKKDSTDSKDKKDSKQEDDNPGPCKLTPGKLRLENLSIFCEKLGFHSESSTYSHPSRKEGRQEVWHEGSQEGYSPGFPGQEH